MKRYVVTNTKSVRYTYRVEASSKAEAQRLADNLSPSESDIIEDRWVVVPDVPPAKGNA